VSDTLDLLVGGSEGAAEKLLLIERPGADGRVRLRSWTSDDWSAAPTSSECNASSLLQEIEGALRGGHTLNREISVVRQWLGSRPSP
jgi:hypothetical protein